MYALLIYRFLGSRAKYFSCHQYDSGLKLKKKWLVLRALFFPPPTNLPVHPFANRDQVNCWDQYDDDVIIAVILTVIIAQHLSFIWVFYLRTRTEPVSKTLLLEFIF
jgi:hypothetical protein